MFSFRVMFVTSLQRGHNLESWVIPYQHFLKLIGHYCAALPLWAVLMCLTWLLMCDKDLKQIWHSKGFCLSSTANMWTFKSELSPKLLGQIKHLCALIPLCTVQICAEHFSFREKFFKQIFAFHEHWKHEFSSCFLLRSTLNKRHTCVLWFFHELLFCERLSYLRRRKKMYRFHIEKVSAFHVRLRCAISAMTFL